MVRIKNQSNCLAVALFTILVASIAHVSTARADNLNQYMAKNPDGTVEVDMGAYCFDKTGLCVYKNDGIEISMSSTTDNKYNGYPLAQDDRNWSELDSGHFTTLSGSKLKIDLDEDQEMTNPIIQTNLPIRSVTVGFLGIFVDENNGEYLATCGFKNSKLNLQGEQTSFLDNQVYASDPDSSNCMMSDISGGSFPVSTFSKRYSINEQNIEDLNLNSQGRDEGGVVLRVVVDAGASAASLQNVTTADATRLALILEQAKSNLSTVYASISDTQKPHLKRYMNAIDGALAALKFDGKNAHVPLTEESVVEALRLVMVMGHVAEVEIFDHYKTAPWAQGPFKEIDQTVQAIRNNYFRDSLLAGKPSKTIAVLSDMVESDLHTLVQLMNATRQGYVPTALSQAWAKAQILQEVVYGMRGGDAQAWPQVEALASIWNSVQFQSLLKQLLNSGRDVNNTVQPVLQNLLSAVMSMNSITGIYFVVPGK